MSSDPNPQGGFFAALARFIKSLFSSSDDDAAELLTDKQTLPPPPAPPVIPAPPVETVPPIIAPPLNAAVLKYGDTVITLSKSERYFAVRSSANTDRSITQMSVRSLPNVKEDTRRLGHFELIETSGGGIATLNVNDTLNKARALPGVEIGTHVYHLENGNDTPLVPTGEVFIRFQPNADLNTCKKLVEQYFLSIKEVRSERELVCKISKKSPNPLKVCLGLQQSGLVVRAEPELESPVHFSNFVLPSDDLLRDQWHLQNKGKHGDWPANSFKAGSDAKVVEAWNWLQSLGSNKITVAVIDSGFDISHPDLRGNGDKIVAPFDFETSTTDPSPHAGDWHGTSCAGVAVGAANGIGIVGAAPNSKLMPMRFSYISDSQIEAWFNHCVKNGADVISNSWGSSDPNFVLSTRMIEAMKKAGTEGRNGKGCVILFAAGNTKRNIANPTNPNAIGGFPTHPNVIAISASNSKDERADYTNFGKQIAICAPSNGSGGAGVTTTDVTGTLPLPSGGFGYKGYDAGDYTNSFGGTSSACPLAAGICALILSVKPDLTAAQVREILQSTADKIGNASDYDSNGHSIFFGYGRVNALKAVQKARDGKISVTPPPVTPPPPKPPVTPPPVVPIINDSGTVPLPFEGHRSGVLTRVGMMRCFKVSLSQHLIVRLDSPEGKNDFDLYLRKNNLPDPRHYDFISAGDGSDEQLSIPKPGQANFYIMLRAIEGAGGYNLEASLSATSSDPDIEALPLQGLVGGVLRDRNSQIIYKACNGRKLEVYLDSPEGLKDRNFDIYVRRGNLPTTSLYDYRGARVDSNEKIEIINPTAGDYYIMVYATKGAGAFNLKVVLT